MNFVTAPLSLIWSKRVLALELARRELFERYGLSAFGRFWAVFQPLALMAVLAFVFVYVFRVRIGGTNSTPGIDYTLFMCAGFQAWMGISAGLSASSQAVIGNAPLIKQIEFPTPILVVKATLTALIPQAVGLTFVLFYSVIALGYISPLLPLLGPLLLLQIFAMIGLGWMCAVITVFFRDFSEVLSTFLMISLYILPIVYPPTAIPREFQVAISLNPFSHMIYAYQDVLVYGAIQHPESWAVLAGLALVTFFLGYRMFRRTQHVFGELV
jgi:lipopolysaccharide transport system permease protein